VESVRLIDDSVVVACALPEAKTVLHDPSSVASWFGATRVAEGIIIQTTGERSLVFKPDRLVWLAHEHALVAEGAVASLRYCAHVTLRSVIQAQSSGTLGDATEIWVHVELTPARAAAWTAALLREAIRRGLEHLRLELDVRV
jgi:hypothetical protein